MVYVGECSVGKLGYEIMRHSWINIDLESRPPKNFPPTLTQLPKFTRRIHHISPLHLSISCDILQSMATTALLPGEDVPTSSLPQARKGTLTLGPGLRHTPPSTISATTLGSLNADPKKSALWLEGSGTARYQPAVNDLVIAQIHHSATDVFLCALTPHTPFVNLGQLSFEGANKKTRPKLESGDLVYARVAKAGSSAEEVEIECINSNTGKAEGMGPLKGGMVFDVSPGFARRLMMGRKKGEVCVLDMVGEKIRFEVAVGRNGRVWVDSGNVSTTAALGRLLAGADTGRWNLEDQEKAVRKALKDMT